MSPWFPAASNGASSLNSSVRWLAQPRVRRATSTDNRNGSRQPGLKSRNLLGYNIRCDDSGGDISPARRQRFRQLSATRETRDRRDGGDLSRAPVVVTRRQQGHDGPQA